MALFDPKKNNCCELPPHVYGLGDHCLDHEVLIVGRNNEMFPFHTCSIGNSEYILSQQFIVAGRVVFVL